MKHPVKTRGFVQSSVSDCTSAVNAATRTREVGDAVDCNLVHSINSFSFNALMSCLMESSRTESRVMVVAVYPGAPATVCVWKIRVVFLHQSVIVWQPGCHIESIDRFLSLAMATTKISSCGNAWALPTPNQPSRGQ